MTKLSSSLDWLTLKDLGNLCRRSKKKIALAMALGASLAAVYGALKPIQYQAKASFKDKMNLSKVGALDLSSSFFLGTAIAPNESGIGSLLKSRYLLAPLIAEYGMQASIIPASAEGWKMQLKGNLGHLKNQFKIQF